MNIGAKKKVMFLITKSNWGGAQRYVYDIATSLDTQKFSVVVVLGGDGTLAEMLKHAGIKTISISSLQRDVSIKKELAFINDLTKILKEEKPDVLHVNSSKAGLVGTFVGRITRVPRIIFTAHGWAFNEDRSYSQKIVLKVFHWLTVLLSHKTIAVSNAIVSQLQWLGIKNKFIVINPGRTIGVTYNKQEAREKIISLYPDLSRHENHTWIMTIAELHPIKRFNILIDAMKILVESYPNLTCVIVGDGEKKVSLKQQIADNSLNNNVFLVGAINEAARFLKAANVFVLPSASESYGYVVHEAGLAHIPIVASDVGGIKDIISNESEGLLIAPDNSRLLANTISEVLTNEKVAQARADKLFEKLTGRSKDKMVIATTAVYELAL